MQELFMKWVTLNETQDLIEELTNEQKSGNIST